MPSIIVPLADGFEEIETIAPVDILRRAGFEVTVASLAPTRHATGRSGVTIHSDATLDDVSNREFDMVFLPGGPGVKNLRADPRVIALVKRHHDDGKWLAAICAAPTILNDCGLLVGKRYTAHYSTADELPAILAEDRVVIDGRIATSRGAGTAVEFGLELVRLLAFREKASEIGKSICI